jgi:hypothetical protein
VHCNGLFGVIQSDGHKNIKSFYAENDERRCVKGWRCGEVSNEEVFSGKVELVLRECEKKLEVKLVRN